MAGRSSHLTWTLPLKVTLLIPEPKVKAKQSRVKRTSTSLVVSHFFSFSHQFPPRFPRRFGHCYPSSRPPLSRASTARVSLLVHALTTFSTPLLLVESVGDAAPPHSTSASLCRVKHYLTPNLFNFIATSIKTTRLESPQDRDYPTVRCTLNASA